MKTVMVCFQSQKGAAVAMAAEQLPCSPWEGFSKEAFRNSDLWEPRMRQVPDGCFGALSGSLRLRWEEGGVGAGEEFIIKSKN